MNVISSPGASAVLSCQVQGSVRHNLTWYRAGTVLSSRSGRVKVLANSSLEISWVRTQDAGPYQCRAANAHGESQAVVSLVVLGTVHHLVEQSTCGLMSPTIMCSPLQPSKPQHKFDTASKIEPSMFQIRETNAILLNNKMNKSEMCISLGIMFSMCSYATTDIIPLCLRSPIFCTQKYPHVLPKAHAFKATSKQIFDINIKAYGFGMTYG